MSILTLHQLDEPVMALLRKQAETNRRSIEEEASEILRRVLLHQPGQDGLGTRIALRFSEVGGFDLPEPICSLPRPTSDFMQE